VRVEAVGKKVRGLFQGFMGASGSAGAGGGGDGRGAHPNSSGGHGDGGVNIPGSDEREDAGVTQRHPESVPKRNRTIRLRFKRKDRVDTWRK
jgi:hypothetical protein